MKALVLEEYNRLVYQDVPEPTIGPNDVLIAVKACGICGSDIHGMDGSTGRRIPPLIMGHEAAGVIVDVGAAVRGWKPGDRVTFDSTIYCGECFFCRRGQINLCDNRQVLGVSCGDYRRHGAFAEYVVVPERIIAPLPENLSFEEAAMIEPASVAVHAVDLTPVRLGDTAVVVGTGMIGLLVVQALRLAGCGRIIAVDVDAARLRMAADFGAEVEVNAREADPAAAVAELTSGRGADVAVEAVGATQPIATAIACLRKGGALTLVGNVTPRIELALQAVVTRELRLTGSCASCGEYPAVIALMARGAIRVRPMISAMAPLAEAPHWFDRLYRKEPNLMKVILKP